MTARFDYDSFLTYILLLYTYLANGSLRFCRVATPASRHGARLPGTRALTQEERMCCGSGHVFQVEQSLEIIDGCRHTWSVFRMWAYALECDGCYFFGGFHRVLSPEFGIHDVSQFPTGV